MEQAKWSLVCGTCETPGAEGAPVYGVAAQCPDGGVWTWPDVDTDRAVVCRLVERLQATQPQRCHFEEMVADFIEEMAGSPL